MDLRLDIERRKIYSTHERDNNQDRGRDLGDSPNSSRERSLEKFSKCPKRSGKSKKKRSRSRSSSSSSSRKSQHEGDLPLNKSDPKDEGFNRVQLGQGELPGSERGRPRGFHDDRDEEADGKWMDNQGRGRGSFSRGKARFIIRNATGGSSTNNPRWAHDKLQVNGGKGGPQEEETRQDHNGGDIDGDNN